MVTVCYVCSSHDGQYIVCGSEDHFVYIWRTQHGIASSRRDKNDYFESFSGMRCFFVSMNSSQFLGKKRLRNKTCSPCLHSLVKTELNIWEN